MAQSGRVTGPSRFNIHQTKHTPTVEYPLLVKRVFAEAPAVSKPAAHVKRSQRRAERLPPLAALALGSW